MPARPTFLLAFVGLLSSLALAGARPDRSTAQGPTDEIRTLPAELVAKLDAKVAERMEQGNLPGVLVAIDIPGKGRYVAARGKANLETGRPPRAGDPFRIASITKTFTATGVLILADRGKLDLSDQVAKWFPDVPNADRITVENLLRMRSGLADPVDHAFMAEYYRNPLLDLDAGELIRRSRARVDRCIAPDQKTQYTELNYILLGEIVRRVSGQAPGDFIHEAVCQPLGLKDTTWPNSTEMPGGLRGYGWNRQTKSFEDKTLLNPAVAGGAGAMVSTLADLQAYARALYKGTLLKPETQKARLECRPLAGAPSWVEYGEGVGRFGRFWGHNGGIWGYSSEMFYLPEEDATFVICVNRNDADERSHADALFFSLSKVLFPKYVEW